ncbi:MAG: hypothetical protein SGJ09_17280 [Phycisphaerae bacterium]|nr:hypothetical protein [Phycisphaerae bacterium]
MAVRIVLFVVAASAAAGCASDPQPSANEVHAGDAQPTTSDPRGGQVAIATDADPLGSLPNDLVLDVTVLAGFDARHSDLAHHVRSRYIVLPDGSLRGDVGRSVDFLTRPAQVRTVTREKLADLWLIARQSGFGELSAANFEGNPALLQPASTEILTIVWVRANGQVGVFVERTTLSPSASEDVTDVTPAGRLVRAIARLAWASDDMPTEAMVLPLRYDLGPDPYARFRPAAKPPTKPASPKPSPAPAPPVTK